MMLFDDVNRKKNKDKEFKKLWRFFKGMNKKISIFQYIRCLIKKNCYYVFQKKLRNIVRIYLLLTIKKNEISLKYVNTLLFISFVLVITLHTSSSLYRELSVIKLIQWEKFIITHLLSVYHRTLPLSYISSTHFLYLPLILYSRSFLPSSPSYPFLNPVSLLSPLFSIPYRLSSFTMLPSL